MLRRGFPVTALSQYGAKPLHWAAFHGNAAMMEEVLRYNPRIDAQDRQFHGVGDLTQSLFRRTRPELQIGGKDRVGACIVAAPECVKRS